MVFGRVRERARERRGEPGESEREQGGGVASSRGIEARRGGQAGRRARGVARWRARAGHTPLPLSRTKTTEEGGGLGRLLAGPASWLGRRRQVRGPGKVPLFYLFLFSNF